MLSQQLRYCLALQPKPGELKAIQRLGPDVRDRILTRWLLHRQKEKDKEERRVFTPDEYAEKVGKRLGNAMPMSTFLVDPEGPAKDFGTEDSGWFRRIVRRVREHKCVPIPVASLSDLSGPKAKLFGEAFDEIGSGACGLKVKAEDIEYKFSGKVQNSLRNLGLRTEQCILLIDLGGSDVFDSSIFADIIIGNWSSVWEAGRWNRAILQLPSFPKTNPAKPGGLAKIKRHDWDTWQALYHRDATIAEHLMYGDYGTEWAEAFKTISDGRAVPHLRFTGNANCIVAKGGSDTTQREAMASIANKISQTDEFPGEDLCPTDTWIRNLAKGKASVGNPTTWRESNVGRHATKVVSDLGEYYSYEIARAIKNPSFQVELFSEE